MQAVLGNATQSLDALVTDVPPGLVSLLADVLEEVAEVCDNTLTIPFTASSTCFVQCIRARYGHMLM